MPQPIPFEEAAIPIVRKLLQAHGREAEARRLFMFDDERAVRAAATVTNAAIVELAQLLDDRMQNHIARLVRRAGLSLTESAS